MADTRNNFSPENGSNIDNEIAQLKSDNQSLHARLNAIILPEKINELDREIDILRVKVDEAPETVEQLQEKIAELMQGRNFLSLMLAGAVKLTKFNHLSNLKDLKQLIKENEERIQELQKSDKRKGKEEASQDEHTTDAIALAKEEISLTVDKKYLKLRDAFRDKLAELPQNAAPELKRFYQRGVELHKTIVAQEKKQNFNAKVYGEIFETASELLLTPGDENLHKRLSGLPVDGHRSIIKNIFYAVSAFLAAAAVVAVGLGFSVLLPVVSWPAAISCFAAGAVLFAGGVAVCVNGRKKGTAKAIDNFEAAAGKLPKSGLFAAPVIDLQQRPTEDVTGCVMK